MKPTLTLLTTLLLALLAVLQVANNLKGKGLNQP